MKKQKNTAEMPKKVKSNIFKDFAYDIKTNKWLMLMCLPAIVFFIVFAYIPMFGLVMAFQDFKITTGFLHSKFVGLKNFEFLFTDDFARVAFNTLYLNVLFIVASMICAILIAILLSEIKNKYFKKVTQSIVILPHFISWTVVAMILEAFISTEYGVINRAITSMGGEAVNFYQNAGIWPLFLTLLRIWHGAGFDSIVYLAAITGIDQEIFEAARVDGATRVQCLRYLTLPLLKNTAILLLIMAVGKIFNGDFGMIYALVGANTQLYEVTDVIDTYVYRSLTEISNVSMPAAVSFFQSCIGFILVYITNAISRKVNPESAVF